MLKGVSTELMFGQMVPPLPALRRMCRVLHYVRIEAAGVHAGIDETAAISSKTCWHPRVSPIPSVADEVYCESVRPVPRCPVWSFAFVRC